ncbi:Hypothetical predicted protein [Prunus dulcis]|uniref:Uncharacterized protein n=1 Tax=Prunus dulcis TaxID=3755 RepID=A0A5E4EIW0_PRUDU|nr:Hypothetical predicted protein [Prunus dulcis]
MGRICAKQQTTWPKPERSLKLELSFPLHFDSELCGSVTKIPVARLQNLVRFSAPLEYRAS